MGSFDLDTRVGFESTEFVTGASEAIAEEFRWTTPS